MKKSQRIALWVCVSIAAFVVLFLTCADVAVSRVAEKKVNQALAEANLPFTLELGHIHVLLVSGCVTVDDIHFAANSKALNNAPLDTVDVTVPHVVVRNISYMDLIKHQKVSVDAVRLRKVSAHIKGKGSKLDVQVDSLTVEARDLFYSIKDTTYGFNDSIYYVKLRHAVATEPKGLMSFEVRDLVTEDAGEIHLGKTRIWNCVPKTELSQILHEPASWMDLKLNSVVINPINLIRTDWKKGVNIDQITVHADKMETLRDARLKPSKPYEMPQKAILALKYPIRIGKVDLDMKTLIAEVMLTDKNTGKLELSKINATVSDFRNKKGSVMKVNMKANLGEGAMSGEFKMHMNNECRFDMDLVGYHAKTESLTPMIRPLTGIEMNCIVDSLKAKYTGDNVKAAGVVMMAYHDLSAKVYKEDDIPFAIIKQNAGALEYFVNNLIPKSNPRNDSKAPLAYNVEWKRKDDQNFPLYMVGPIIMGAVQTFLPGFFAGKKSKE